MNNFSNMMMGDQFRKMESTYSPKSSPHGGRSPVVSRQDSSGTLKTTISLGKTPTIIQTGPFYSMKEPPGKGELTGDKDLMTEYGLHHTLTKFKDKKVKESLSSFLPNLPGINDGWNNMENSTLRSVIEKPPIGGKELLPLTSVQLAGFRLHPGPLPEQYLALNAIPARKHKNKHKKHKHKDGAVTQETSLLDSAGLETYEKKHKKQKRHEDDKERKKRKKEKKRKKKSHSPEPGSASSIVATGVGSGTATPIPTAVVPVGVSQAGGPGGLSLGIGVGVGPGSILPSQMQIIHGQQQQQQQVGPSQMSAGVSMQQGPSLPPSQLNNHQQQQQLLQSSTSPMLGMGSGAVGGPGDRGSSSLGPSVSIGGSGGSLTNVSLASVSASGGGPVTNVFGVGVGGVGGCSNGASMMTGSGVSAAGGSIVNSASVIGGQSGPGGVGGVGVGVGVGGLGGSLLSSQQTSLY